MASVAPPHRPAQGETETAATTAKSTSTRRPSPAPRVRRDKVTSHDGFLSYAGGRWAKANREGPEPPKKAIKCDMCSGIDGGPACVRACPTGAAIRVGPEKFLSVAQLGKVD